MRRRFGITLGATLLASACARGTPAPRVESREVEYQQAGTTLQGTLAWDAARSERRPGVLVVHEWWGHNDYARHRAQQLAELGYVAFALDMYGKGKVTTHPQEAEAFLTEAVKDPGQLAARFAAALDLLKRDPHVDSTRIAAIGYCFGGMVVLSMAQTGADLDAVVSFHGALPQGPVDSGRVTARVLVLTGDADPFVSSAAVDSFRTSMERAGARIAVVQYPGVKHSFSNPDAASFGMPQLAYDAHADSASWGVMRDLFRDVWHE